jgi:CDP-glucose 4,6-dehydratase
MPRGIEEYGGMNFEEALRCFAGKRVLVTGHNGFKGTWLSLWLRRLGARVLGASLDPPSDPAMSVVVDLGADLEHCRVDIRDAGALARVVADFQPEAVFHLAAQPLVRLSYQTPLETFDTNVMGVANLLEACRRLENGCAVLVVTSDKCYRNNEWVWGYRENDPLGGHDPYSASKGCAELVAQAYAHSFFPAETFGRDHRVAMASARAGNVIGGGDWGAERLVPDCIRAMGRGEAVSIRYPHAVRPWQHVLECLSGYLTLCARLLVNGPAYAGAWNFGPAHCGDEWNVGRIVQAMSELWGNGSYVIDTQPQPHEARMLRLDCSKANIDLRWRPRYSVAKALEATIAWHKEHASGASAAAMRALTLGQIEEYSNTQMQD